MEIEIECRDDILSTKITNKTILTISSQPREKRGCMECLFLFSRR